MQECLVGFLGGALESVAPRRRKHRAQVLPSLADTGTRHLQEQVMLEAVAIGPHARRQMLRQQLREAEEAALQHGVAAAGHPPLQLIESQLQVPQCRHPGGTEVPNRKKSVLAEALRHIEGGPMNILPGYRQTVEPPQDVAPDTGEHRRVACADIEEASLLLPRKGIHPYCKHRELSGAAGRFEQSARIRIEPRRQLSLELANSECISIVRTTASKPRCTAHLKLPALELPNRLLRLLAQLQIQMVHQAQGATLTHLREKRHLGVGRPATHQRSAGVIADSSDHGCAEAGGAEHRMRLTA